MTYPRPQSRFITLLSLLCLLAALLQSLPANAQQRSTDALEQSVATEDVANGLQIQWGSDDGSVSAASVISRLPIHRYQGYELPLELVTIELENVSQSPLLQIQQVTADVMAADAIQPAAQLMPAVIDDEGEYDLSRNVEEVALPTAPAFVLRAGVVDGKSVAVVAISPIYSENGETKLASQIKVFVPSARLATSVDVASADVASAEQSVLAPNAAIPNLPPINSSAAKKAAKIIVSTSGMQRVPFTEITKAGLSTSKLGLSHNGTAVATQIVNNELRFYVAPTIGDRWNSSAIYWLTDDGSNVLAMSSRSVASSNATSRTTAIEKGVWRDTPEYISRYAGPDGDHWFAAAMEVANPVVINAPTVSQLPKAGGTSYTLNLTPLTRTDDERRCTLNVKSGVETVSIDINAMITNTQGLPGLANTWSGVVASSVSTPTIAISLISRVVPKDVNNPPNPPACAVYFDTVEWARTVTLNFGGKSALFSGVEGTWNYRWSNLPTGSTFYDVTNPNKPVLLTGQTNAGFQDGATAHDYALVAANGWKTPQIVADNSFSFSSISGAHAVYVIAPSFDRLKNSRTLLEPLVQRRQNQGYKVAVIDVQDIYDAWSFGAVSPEAIRNFLQFAATNWNPKPKSVVLVGDGTQDPHNWGEVPADKSNNLNYIPPFMGQNVDPWLGEAACDSCYGQLNGTDAVSGDSTTSNSNFFDIDVWVGRFPVKNEQDLMTAVNKIISYETATDLEASWRTTSVFMADNWIKSLINPATQKYANPPVPAFDPAGNFAKDMDTQIARLNSAAGARRVYYDPYPAYSDAKPGESWRISDPSNVMPTVISTVSQGAGVVVYGGHSNHWNMGNLEYDRNKDLGGGVVISESVPNGYNVLQLYDVDNYANTNKYFIQLSMTCLTAQYVRPAASGTTIDERVFLNPNGGAVAVWGPAGLSVAHGHDKLQEGFFKALKGNVKMNMPIGQLFEAGMQELLLHGSCRQDALQTFVVFGDPLTPARTFIPRNVFLPLINR